MQTQWEEVDIKYTNRHIHTLWLAPYSIYVDEAKQWRYSSARDYEDIKDLVDIERFW